MYSANDLWNRVFGVIVLAAAILLVWALMRSPWGRVLKGIREDEDAVRSLGKNVFAYKMQALVVGGDHHEASRSSEVAVGVPPANADIDQPPPSSHGSSGFAAAYSAIRAR